MNGLEDVIAQRYGLAMCTEGQSFAQIINIRNNHWITLSNAKCSVGTRKIYDSLNQKSKFGGRERKNKVSYKC